MSLLLLLGGEEPTPVVPPVSATRVLSEPIDDALFVKLVDVNGRPSRRAGDEPEARDIPIGLKSATSAPGGHQDCSFTLLRDPRRTWSDLNLVDEVIACGRTKPLNRNVFEGQIASLPSSLGEATSITVNAVGDQILLSDNEAFRALYVQLGTEGWDDAPLARREALASFSDPQGKIALSTGPGGLVWDPPNEQLAFKEIAEAVSRLPAGLKVAKVGYRGVRKGTWSKFEAPYLYSSDGEAVYPESESDRVSLTLDGTARVATLPTPRTFAILRAFVIEAHTPTAGVQQSFDLLARYGDHGLTLREIPGALPGVYAHDALEHMLAIGAPDLQFKVGANGTITPNTNFIIPDLAFPEPTTVKAALEKLNAYFLNNWAVWDDKKFYWQPWDPDRLTWKASVAGGAHWNPTGRQVETLLNGLIVDFTDAGGISRTAGPPGSGCDYEHASLQDSDPNNPYTRRGRRRWGTLSVGFPLAYASTAVQIGAVFLAESKMPQRAGALTIQPKPGGHIPSIRHPTMGALPIWAMRAGDYCELDGWPESEPFRVISTDYDHDAKTLTAQLDTGAARLTALLERVGVRLTGIV